MNMRDFLNWDPPERYDFTDVTEGEYAKKHGIDKYVLYKLSAIKKRTNGTTREKFIIRKQPVNGRN